MKTQPIAACGVNCTVCYAYLRDKNKCPGCQGSNINKPKHCINCSIVNCEFLSETTSKFCYECKKFPCRRIKQLDKRYNTKYNTSLIENLEFIMENGVHEFLTRENIKWKCSKCGRTICMHTGLCQKCEKSDKEKTTA